MENHNSWTVISRYLVRQGVRLAALALVFWGWGAAWAQFNQVQTNNGTNPSNSNPSNGGFDNGGYGGYNGGYGGYNGGYGGYNGGYGGYNGGYNGGYGGYNGGMSGGYGSSRLGSNSSRFGSSRSNRSGSGTSRFGSNRDGDTENSSASDFQSRRGRARDGSEQSGRRTSSRTSRTKKGNAGEIQTQQSTRSMGKDNVSQRKTSTGGKGGGGGAEAAPLPELKIDPKLIEDALFFSPSFANVSPGDQFITTVAFYNHGQHKVDEVDIWIKYNPDQVEPVWADTSKLKELNPGPIESRIWAKEGYIQLAAKLADSPKGFTTEFADIYWRALTPTLETRIELAGPEGKVTALRAAGKNLIEGGKLANSQKLSASITITPLDWEEPGLRTAAQVDDMTPPAPLDKDNRLRLAIVSPKKEVATGEVATADVMLLNPAGLAFDEVKMRIRFNPDEVTILDADQENFIADGLNIYDGGFHQRFPFDGHVRNLVDLDHGTIDYQVASVMGPRVFQTGAFARIVYRMKRNAGKTAFWFEAEDPLLRVRQTDVTARGRSLLGDGTDTAAQALHGIEIAVRPLELKPLELKFQALNTTAQAR